MVKITCPCRKKAPTEPQALPQAASILDLEGKSPLRLKPLSDMAITLRTKAVDISRLAGNTLCRLNQSFWEMMGVETALARLHNVTLKDMATALAPYALTYGFFSLEEHYLQNFSHYDALKLAMSFVFMGYLFSFRVTEQRHETAAVKVIKQAATFFTFISLHQMFYNAMHSLSHRVLGSFEREKYITQDSKDNLSILMSLISSFALLPKLILLYEHVIRTQKQKYEKNWGLKTQSSALAKIPSGVNFESNIILNCYDHFTQQLHDPSRLFQYFIVSMNVLRDSQIPDPDALEVAPQKGLAYTLNKTRNCWLLLIDSVVKAKSDLQFRLEQLSHDTRINNELYTVMREGKTLSFIKRHELKVGDLVSLDQAIDTVIDPKNGHRRLKAKLCGYIVSLNAEDKDRKIAISLIELNGENHPVIVTPSVGAKTRSNCLDVDLLKIPLTAGILPGTEFITFDQKKHGSRPSGLYLQIAKAQALKEPIIEKTPLSLRHIKQLKDRLIFQTLCLSVITSLPLMRWNVVPRTLRRGIQFYGTEFIDKFTQVFSETQQMIPLVSEMALEMVNSSLLKEINAKLGSKLSLNQALLIADLFEALSRKNVRILSDKTGTVTETFMRVKGIQQIAPLEQIALSFATTFSDQRTEAEENEIRDYLESAHNITLTAEPSGPYGCFDKTLTFNEDRSLSFCTKKLGLFTNFGGQFSIREEKGKPPYLVFCGIPKDQEGAHANFHGTSLLSSYKAYESEQAGLLDARMDSLTRDWCIAECLLSLEDHALIIEALSDTNFEQAKAKMKIVLQKVLHDLTYLGVFQIDNPIKKDAAKTIKAWKQSQIDFTLITGDTKNAAFMIAIKLYGVLSDHIHDACSITTLLEVDDLSSHAVIFTDTKQETLKLYEGLLRRGLKKPWIIFAQMKETDKKTIAEHAKSLNSFVVASGDGCNDIMMFNSSHLAITSSAPDGSFARGVEDVSSLSDIQIRQLLAKPESSLYELFDIHLGKDSVFLKSFARLANSQPKVITSLLGKSLKSMAVPRLLGRFTREIPGQFGVLLAYDAGFLASVYHKTLDSASTPLIKEPIHRSNLPYAVLITAVALGALESLYAYSYHNQQIVTLPILAMNLGLSIGCLSLFLAPPGFKKQGA